MPEDLSHLGVLAVEDNVVLLMHLEDMLTDLGVGSVWSAVSVGEAEVLLDDRTFDLAIIDVKLGSESGIKVADRCHAKGIPVILATGYGDALGHTLRRGELVLAKPFSEADLVGAIKTSFED